MNPSLRARRIFFVLSLSLCTGPFLEAHLPPTPEEVAELKKQGIYEKRVELVGSMGNNTFSDSVFRRAQVKLLRASLQAQGLSAKEVERRLEREHKVVPRDWVGMPTTGTPRVPTILIDFPDQRASVNFPNITPSDIAANIYGTGTTTARNHMPFNSVADFYRRASHNKLDMKGNVLGFFTMPNNQLSYAPLNAQPDNQKLFDIAVTALRSIDATHDFAQYDNNNDGYIDGINIIYVGQGGQWSSFWWAYRWLFQVAAVENTFFDGKKLSWFTWQRLDTRAGGTDFDPQTLIHETGHLLGLPDLYDYKPGEGLEGGVGGFDVMDANRANPNAFLRWMMEWISPEVVSAGAPASRTLSASADTSTDQNKAVAIFPNATNTPFQEFFMIENRHRTGNDGGESFLPTDGLAIWHIDATLNAAGTDFAFNNNDRPTTAHKLVKLVQADGLEQVEGGGRFDAGDFYTSGKSLTPTSTPNSRSYANQNTNISVSNISPSGLVMTLDIGFLGQGGQPDLRDAGAASHGLSSTSRQPGESLTITGRVQNGGTVAGGGFSVVFYASTDANITTSDTLLGQRAVGGLGAGASAALDHTVTVPQMPAGTYRIGWLLDPAGAVSESDESNNTVVVAPQLTIGGTSVADLDVRGAGLIIAHDDTSPRIDDGTLFDSVQVGGERQNSFALVNRGTAPLTGISLSLTGADAGSFMVSSAPPATLAAGDSGTATIAFRPLSSGTKVATVTVASNDPDTPSYRFSIQGNGLSANDDHGNSAGAATVVSVPSTTGGILETGGDEDFFTFTIAQTGVLTVSTTGAIDTFGQLLASGAGILQESDDDGDGLNFRIAAVLNPGTYFVRVGGYDNTVTGSYSLGFTFTAGISDDHGNTIATATNTALSTTVSGSLETGGDIDVFTFTLPAAGTLTLQSQGTTDTFGRVFDGTPSEFAIDDDSGVERNFLLSGNIAAGTYSLAVSGYDASVTGPYVVSISFAAQILTDDHGDDIFSATAQFPAGVNFGTLETGGDIDVFAVTVIQPGILTCYTTGETDTFGFLDVLSDDDAGPAFNFLIEAALTAPGTYYVAVQGFDETVTGDYTLLTHFIPTAVFLDDHRSGPIDGFTTAVGLNSATPGTLELPGDTDFFRVTVPGTGVLTVSTSGSTDTYGFLHGPDGTVLTANDDDGPDFNFGITQLITTAGDYFVRVEGFNLAEIGGYTLNVSFSPGLPADDHENNPVAATPVGPNSDTAGALEIGGDLDFFAFTLAETSDVTIGTTGTTDTFGTLLRADGSEVLSNDDMSETDLNFLLGATLPAGTYRVRVQGYDAFLTGVYTLQIRAIPVSTGAAPELVSVTLAPGGASVVVSFLAAAGETYTIETSPDLTVPSWTAAVSGITGTATVQRTVPIAATKAFFRVRRQ